MQERRRTPRGSKVFMGIRIPKEWRQHLQDEATDHSTTMSAIMIRALRSYLIQIQRLQAPTLRVAPRESVR
jgi:hypothetical protein